MSILFDTQLDREQTIALTCNWAAQVTRIFDAGEELDCVVAVAAVRRQNADDHLGLRVDVVTQGTHVRARLIVLQLNATTPTRHRSADRLLNEYIALNAAHALTHISFSL